MTCTIEDFLEPVTIRSADGTCDTFPVNAYVADQKPLSKRCEHSLKHELRMDNFHCCDYIFVPDDNAVLLIEDSNFTSAKERLETKDLASVSDPRSKAKLSRKLIMDEQRLKAYASLLLLCRLLERDKTAAAKMRGKKVHFWFIINDAGSSNLQSFNYLKHEIAPTLRSLVSKVVVLPKEKARDKLSKYVGTTS